MKIQNKYICAIFTSQNNKYVIPDFCNKTIYVLECRINAINQMDTFNRHCIVSKWLILVEHDSPSLNVC